MSTKKNQRMSALLRSRFGSKVRLLEAAPTPGVESILKVKTLDESLRSCLKPQTRGFRRGSLAQPLNLNSLGSSIRHLFGGRRGEDDKATSLSHGTGLDFLEPTVTFDPSSSSSISTTSNVQFSTIHRRFYSVAPDDNPSVSGVGPAIALGGWRYTTEPRQSVDEYEASRPPRKLGEDLKLSMMERYERLKEHGCSAKDINLFSKRVQKAKLLRAETKEEFVLYGMQHLVRQEKRENYKRFFQKLFRFRKHQAEEQADLWENAQKVRIAAATA